MLYDARLVEKNERLHDVAELVQACKIFQVLCYFYQVTQTLNVLFCDDQLGEGVSARLRASGAPDHFVDFI